MLVFKHLSAVCVFFRNEGTLHQDTSPTLSFSFFSTNKRKIIPVAAEHVYNVMLVAHKTASDFDSDHRTFETEG